MKHSYTYLEMTANEKKRMFQLRKGGLSYEKIGKILKRHPTSIYYWFNDEYRLKMIQKVKKRHPRAKDLSIESIKKIRENQRKRRNNL